MLRFSSTVVLFIVSLAAGSAGAAPVTYEFSSTVQGGGIGYYPTYTPGFQPPPNFPSFENGDPGNLYGTLGEPISASITIETATPDSEPDPTVGTYAGVILAFSVDVNGTVFDYDPLHPGASSSLHVYAADGGIFFEAQLGTGILPNPPQDHYNVWFLLSVPNGLTLGSDALDFSLEGFTPWDLDVFVEDRVSGYTYTNVTAFGPVHHVPEPGSALLVGAAAIALAAVHRRSASAPH